MKRWGITAAALGLAILSVFGYWGYRQNADRSQLETALNNNYQMQFFDLRSNVQKLETSLAKSLASNGQGEDAAVLSEIWLRADAAQNNITHLPVPESVTERTTKFLSQVGDYAYTLSRDVVDTKEINNNQFNTLSRLYSQTATLNRDLDSMETKLVDGKLTIGELKQVAKEDLATGSETEKDFSAINREMQSYPGLIYDGPFSDHLEKRQASGITGKSYTAAQAGQIALDFIDKGGSTYTAQVTGKNKGKIMAYTIELKPKSGSGQPTYSCDVSIQGGKVLFFLANKKTGIAKLTVDQGREKAQKFLNSRGLQNMIPTYDKKDGNLLSVQFVAMEKNVVIYPDQIKCTVSLDDGRIVGYEATQYYMAHKDRVIAQPKISMEEARSKITKRFKETSSRSALIPLENYQEILCYEFTGKILDKTYLIYINGDSGKREKIMLLVDTPNGRLSI